MNSDNDYEAAGFDKFFSRNDPPQATLDTLGDPSRSLPFDRTQLTGAQGDNWNMGGISMSAKESLIQLNDGQLHVNDTSTNSSIQASSGNIAYYDSTGNLVVQEGLLPDGATGIRIVDRNQIGLALFARDKYGDTSLKIAQANTEVATASDSQLVFDSRRNLFKIITTATATFNVSSLTSGSTSSSVVPHGLNTVPAVIAFVNGTGSTYLTANKYYSVPTTVPVAIGGKYEAGINYWFQVDSTNITFNVSNYTSLSPITDIGTANFRYYVMIETAS